MGTRGSGEPPPRKYRGERHTPRKSLCTCVCACGARCQAEWKLQAASADGHKLPCSFLPRGSCTRMRRRHTHIHTRIHTPARKHAEASITQSTPHPSANSPPRAARPAQQSPRCTLSRAKVVANSLLPPAPKATKCRKAGLLADRRRAPVAHTGRWGKVASSPAAVSPHTRAHARAAENAPS